MYTKETITSDIFHCARCGQIHIEQEFKKFYRPIRDKDGTTWDYWGLCPISRDPILLLSKVIENEPAT